VVGVTRNDFRRTAATSDLPQPRRPDRSSSAAEELAAGGVPPADPEARGSPGPSVERGRSKTSRSTQRNARQERDENNRNRVNASVSVGGPLWGFCQSGAGALCS
jgi:hypothetical protein